MSGEKPAVKARSVRVQLTRLPEPRFFDQPTAAAYFGISERSFETQWRSYKMPYPNRMGRRLLWDRKILDQFADTVSGIDMWVRVDQKSKK